jgi:hypothetical protein
MRRHNFKPWLLAMRESVEDAAKHFDYKDGQVLAFHGTQHP